MAACAAHPVSYAHEYLQICNWMFSVTVALDPLKLARGKPRGLATCKAEASA